VPHELRGWVWWHVSGAAEAAAAAPPDHYEACLTAGSSAGAVKQIELDLPRTFPRHPWLAQPRGQQALRCVLTAYAGHNPGVGYCQARACVFCVCMFVFGGGGGRVEGAADACVGQPTLLRPCWEHTRATPHPANPHPHPHPQHTHTHTHRA
jgi:hypothetical protein